MESRELDLEAKNPEEATTPTANAETLESPSEAPETVQAEAVKAEAQAETPAAE